MVVIICLESVQDIYEALKSLGIFILPQGQASDPPSILESSESDDVTSAAQPRVDELVEHYVNAYEEGNPQQLNASVSPNHPSSSISVERWENILKFVVNVLNKVLIAFSIIKCSFSSFVLLQTICKCFSS